MTGQSFGKKILYERNEKLGNFVKVYNFFRYQQAIADWQSWSENQNAEYSNLQTTLAQYVEAYNATAAELAQLQAASSANAAGDDSSQKDEEIAKLKAAVRAKGIEIEDLVSSISFSLPSQQSWVRI